MINFEFLFTLRILFLQAVEESLKSVNLFHGGVADKQAGKYSGGMKRRLSVAISLIGDPKVYFDLCSACFYLYGLFSIYRYLDMLLVKFSGKFSVGCLHG